ncbi:MAG: ABC transporter substrate-binding protein [Trueperaceae bacterium]|nr:ABC transporter substrate-binding protein [Trueperaceae bacterium]
MRPFHGGPCGGIPRSDRYRSGAATEIVWALGAGDRSSTVDLSTPTCCGRRCGICRRSATCGNQPEGVLSMEPDLVVATGALGPPAAREMMERVRVPVVWLPDPVEVDDLRRSVRRVAEKLGRTEKAESLLDKVEARLNEVRDRAVRSFARSLRSSFSNRRAPLRRNGGGTEHPRRHAHPPRRRA